MKWIGSIPMTISVLGWAEQAIKGDGKTRD